MKIDICTQFFGWVAEAKVLNLVTDDHDDDDENDDEGNGDHNNM